MKTIASHTLGCKVNQYDTQAMLELFQADGYEVVPMDQPADVYLVNTCTVTGTGDKKSLQLIRKIRREQPSAGLIVCGCMAQQRGEDLLALGPDLVIGTQRRGDVVSLYHESLRTGRPICAVEPLQSGQPFECLSITTQNEHTRAVLKIQEGCGNRCSYCIIPSVRGPIRSRPLEDIRAEVARLSAAGFREIVLTGIHLCSYGKDMEPSLSLLDAIEAVQQTEGIQRIRLGSLEPTVATPEFAARLRQADKICPQFHLAIQSGCDETLKRMNRHYDVAQFRHVCEKIRSVFDNPSITTDIMVGFAGETEEEFAESVGFAKEIGFARSHVFAYSRRKGTRADTFPEQVDEHVKSLRSEEMIRATADSAAEFLHSQLGRKVKILAEREVAPGVFEGYTENYTPARIPGEGLNGRIIPATVTEVCDGYVMCSAL